MEEQEKSCDTCIYVPLDPECRDCQDYSKHDTNDEPGGLGAWMLNYDCTGPCKAECEHAPDCNLKPPTQDCDKCHCSWGCNV